MATHLRSCRIWCGGDSVVRPLVEPANLPCTRHGALHALHRIAGGLGCRLRLGLGQAVAGPRANLRVQERRHSGSGHRLRGVAAVRAFVRSLLCLDPTGHRALGHPSPRIACARWKLGRRMVACGADQRGGRLGIKPLGLQRHRRRELRVESSGAESSQRRVSDWTAAHAREVTSCVPTRARPRHGVDTPMTSRRRCRAGGPSWDVWFTVMLRRLQVQCGLQN